VLTGNNQDMDRCLRIDVFKSNNLLVLIHDPGRTFPIDYLAKEAGIHSLALSILCLALFSVALA
jgi:hypothetical protein